MGKNEERFIAGAPTFYSLVLVADFRLFGFSGWMREGAD